MRDLTVLAHLVDSWLDEDVVVVGSLPDAARDLDLLVRPDAGRALAAGLAHAGFVRHGQVWARFVGCRADVTEILAADGWGPAPAAVTRLFEESTALAGYRHLRRPAPHHALLIMAWRLAGEGGPLTDRRRGRLADAMAGDPETWAAARREAAIWRCEHALADLERRWSTGEGVGWPHRVRARAERLEAGGAVAPIAAVCAVVPARRRRTALVVAFSGLDGSGKTTQAKALVEALDALGYPAATAWTRLTYDPAVERVALPVKRVLAVAGKLRSGGPTIDPPTGVQEEDADVEAGDLRTVVSHGDGHHWRERSKTLHAAWTVVVAVINARGHRAAARGAGVDVVVRDRYVLDSIVQLRDEYGRGEALPLPERLLEWIAPRPLRAYFLDVPPEDAFARKQDYPVEELDRHRDGYMRAMADRAVVVLDGRRSPEDLCACVAADVWRALAEQWR